MPVLHNSCCRLAVILFTVLAVCLSPFALDCRADIADGRVLYYSFDVNGGATVADDSGNGKSGSVNGAIWTASGQSGGGYVFDGVNNYIGTTHSASSLGIGGSSPRTISFWHKPDSIQPNQLFCMGDKGSTYNLFGLTLRSDTIEYDIGFHSDGRWGGQYTNDVWAMVTVTYDGTNVALYIDGVLTALHDAPTGPNNQVTLTTSDGMALQIGAYADPTALFYDGMIDEFSVYNRAIPQADVTELYEGVPASPEAVLYYSFDVDNGSLVADDSGNDMTGTVRSATWTASGMAGGAYDFDGVNDFISTSHSASDLGLDGANPRTVSFWIKPRSIQSNYTFCMGDKASEHNLFGMKLRNDSLEFDIDFNADGRLGGQYTNDTWYMVTIVYDGSDVSLYIDSVLTAVHDNPTGPNNPVTLATSDGMPLHIGSYCDQAMLFYDGVIDEFRIYDEALSAAQVTNLYGVDNALMAYYSFSGDATDLSSKGNDGVVSGAALTSDMDGNADSAYEFGVGDSIDLPSRPMSRTQNVFSISAWIKPVTTSKGDVYIHKASNRDVRLFWSHEVSPGAMSWNVTDNLGVTHALTGAVVTVSNWYHVVGVYDGSQQRLYVNGELQASNSWTGNVDWDENALGDSIGGTVDDFLGDIDEVRIYRMALPESQIEELGDTDSDGLPDSWELIYFGDLSSSDGTGDFDGDRQTDREEYESQSDPTVYDSLLPGPVLHYTFDADEGSIASDISGNSFAGTVNSATWTGSGMIGGAYSFDGVDDFVHANVVASDLGVNGANPRTVSFWHCPAAVQPSYVFCMGDKRSPHDLFGVKLRADTREVDIDFHSDGRWGGEYTNGVWHMVAVTYDGTNTSMYLNGSLVPLHNNPSGPNSPVTLSTGDGLPVIIGAYGDTSGLFYNGLIDDFRVYDVALTSNEVIQLSDSDSDGMADGWELTYFGDLTTSDGTGDADGDRLTDRAEYQSGSSPVTVQAGMITVNEWQALNSSTLSDPADGAYDDWVEFHNNSGGSIDLSGYTLTDNLSDPGMYTIPNGTTISDDEYMIVWADGEPAQNGPGTNLHVNFTLSGGGEQIGLFGPDGTLVDSVSFAGMFADQVEGRYPDDDPSIYMLTQPTPGGTNILAVSAVSLVLHYPFDGNANDVSGFGHHGTIHGAALVADRHGNPNSAYDFDGSGDYISTVSTASELGIGGARPRTVNFWMRPDTIQPNYMFCMGDKASSHNLFGMKLRNDTLEFDIDYHSDGRWGGQYTNDVWYMVTVVYDGTDTSLYIDGVLSAVHENPVGPNNPVTLTTSDGMALHLGSYCDPIALFYDGILDEFRIYNGALSQSEITELNDAAPDAMGPTLYYSFDVDNGATVADDSGNGRDGSVNSATWTPAGMSGGAYIFDGTNDYIGTTHVASDLRIDGSKPRTVSFWLKPDTIQPNFSFCIGDKASSRNLFGMKLRNDTLEFDMDFHSEGRWGGFYMVDTWYMITFVYNGTNVSVWVDDNPTQVHKNPSGPNSPITLSTGDGMALHIGSYCDPNSLFYDGLIDEFRVYGRAMPDAEIIDLYEATKGLVAYYPFNGNANDATGNGHDGTVVGATPADDLTGETNSAYSFGGSDYVSLDDSRPLAGLHNDFTISAWIFPTDISQARVYIHRASNRDAQFIYKYGQIFWSIDENSDVDEDHTLESPVLPLEQWIHIAGTYDGDVQNLYINGELVDSDEWSGNVDWTHSFMAAGIGGHSTTGTDRFKGMIDEVKVFNRALSAGEIAVDFGAPSGLISYWRFEAGAGPTAADSVGSNDGTLSGAAWVEESAPVYGAGSALEFSGASSSYVSMPGTMDEYWAEYTIEAWAMRLDHGQGTIISKGRTGGDDMNFRLMNLSDGRLVGGHEYAGGSMVSVTSTVTMATGHWYHVALTYDSSQMSLYVNGTIDDTSISSDEPGAVPNPEPFTVGQNSEHNDGFYGVVDEVRIYDRAVSPEEIALRWTITPRLIVASAGVGGTISPSGLIEIPLFGATNFLVTADADYHIADVAVDGKAVGAFGLGSNVLNYSFPLVSSDAEITALFNSEPTLGVVVSPVDGAAPLRVEFDFGTTTDSQDNIIRGEIDRDGDGDYESMVDDIGNAIVIYARPGVYTSMVRVVDAYGLTDATSQVITVWGSAPTAVLSASTNRGPAPLSVSFDADLSLPSDGQYLVVFEWDFDGDGAVDRISSNGLASWTYGIAGTYPATVMVRDDKGLLDRTSQSITVEPPVSISPTVALAAAPGMGHKPLDVVLTATAGDGDGSIVAYRWDFDGDGNVDLVGIDPVVSHSYVVVGSFNASVTVVDNDGLVQSDSVQITATEPPRTAFQVWISKPTGKKTIAGNAVSIIAHVAPANLTDFVRVDYADAGTTNWINIGGDMASRRRSYQTTWDTTAMPDADYDLRATAYLVDARFGTSVVTRVTVQSAGDEDEDNSGGTHKKTTACNKDKTSKVEVFDGTAVTLPAGTVDANLAVEVELVGVNTNAINGSASGRKSAEANRKVSIEGEPDLSRPVEIIIPYDDDDDDGWVDGADVREDTLTCEWFDKKSGKWKKAMSSEVHPKENKVVVKTYHLTEFGLFGSKNLLQPENGGVLLMATSEFTNTMSTVNLADGNNSSYWRSGWLPSEEQEFIYGFSNYQGVVVTEVSIRNHTENGYASSGFDVMFSVDGSNFVSVTNGMLASHDDQQEHALASIPARYVMLSISSGASSDAWELTEFELHGTMTNDLDADGMNDQWEMQYFGNFDRDGGDDFDGEGLLDREEHDLGSSPILQDSDGDGHSDREESISGSSPMDANDVLAFSHTFEAFSSVDSVWWDQTNLVWRTQTVMQADTHTFSWLALTNHVYEFYESTNLVSTSYWQCIYGPVTGSNEIVSFENSVTNRGAGYYRLIVEEE